MCVKHMKLVLSYISDLGHLEFVRMVTSETTERDETHLCSDYNLYPRVNHNNSAICMIVRSSAINIQWYLNAYSG